MRRHTEQEIEQAAQRFEKLADALDPATVEAQRIDDLRAIASAADTVRADDARLREAVDLARAHGRSWNQIALALGVSSRTANRRRMVPLRL
jgi:DNA-directed RNA polymerase specialized sigma24 family protein